MTAEQQPDLMADKDVDVLTAALGYARLGWPIFPTSGKRPANFIRSWSREATTDPQTIAAWYAGTSGLGIGVHLGPAGLVVIDVDHREHLTQEIQDALDQSQPWIHRGNPERASWVFRSAASIPQASHAWGEVKASGGYIVLAPSPHPDGWTYCWISQPGTAPGWISADLGLLVAPRTSEEGPREPWTGEPASEAHRNAAERLRAHLVASLEACTEGRNNEANRVALILGHYVGHILDETETEGMILQACQTNGLQADDGARSVRATVRSGLQAGSRSPQLPNLGTLFPAYPDGNASTPEVEDPSPEDPWLYGGDLRTATDDESVEPTMLHRTDGQALLYPGGVHNLVGESESGKSWLAIVAVAQEAMAGRPSIYVDFEDHRRTFLERLRVLGVPDEALAHCHYYAAEAGWLGAPGVLLDRHAPVLVVIDATSEGMASMGLDPVGTKDAVDWVRWLRRWTAQGAALVVIDHVVKDQNSQGRWSLGSQHKVAGVQAHYVIEPMGPLVPGERAHVLVKVGKNRAGHVRAASAKGSVADQRSRLQRVAVLQFGGDFMEATRWALVPAQAEDEDQDGGRPGMYVDNLVLDYLREVGEPRSGRQIKANLAGRAGRDKIDDSLHRMVDHGWIVATPGPNRSTLYSMPEEEV